MRKLSLICALLVAISFTGCKSHKKSSEVLGQAIVPFFISLSKTPCYGTCPIYTITANENGQATLDAKRFMNLEGKFTKTLDSAELDSLSQAIAKVDWKSLKSDYLSGYSDLPKTIISYSAIDGDTIVVSWENQLAPEELQELAKVLESVQSTDGWEQAPKN